MFPNDPRIEAVSLREIDPGVPSDLALEDFGYYDNAMSLPDMCALMALAQARAPRRILEIGTSDGLTAAALARVAPNAEIVTVDIAASVRESRGAVTLPWGTVASVSSTRRMGAAFLSDAEIRDRITFNVIEPFRWQPDGDFELIVIDGAHDRDAVAYDTDIALRSVASNGIVVWHDYELIAGALDVPTFLLELAETQRLVHIIGTSLVIRPPAHEGEAVNAAH